MANISTINTWSKSALVLSGILLLIVKTEYYWKQIIGLVPLVVNVIIVLIIVAAVVMMIISSIRIYKESGPLKFRIFLPIGIYLFGLIASFADPFDINAESFQSRAILKGHFGAIMNTAVITFRQNGCVEFEGKGFLGYTYFYKGTWTRNGDTLTTEFEIKDPIPWKSQLILYRDDKLLLPLDSVAVEQHFPGFLLDDEYIDVEFKPRDEKSV